MAARIAQAHGLARLFTARAHIELTVWRFRRQLPAVAVYSAVWAASIPEEG